MKQTEILTHATHENGWFPAVLHELHESKFPFVSRIEFIRSKLSNFSAHVYGVSVDSKKRVLWVSLAGLCSDVRFSGGSPFRWWGFLASLRSDGVIEWILSSNRLGLHSHGLDWV